jgi:hypothetical protein
LKEKEFSPHPPATRIIYDGGQIIYVQSFKTCAELTISHGHISEKFIPTRYILGHSKRRGFRKPTSVNPPSIEAAIIVSRCHVCLKDVAIITLVPQVQSRPVRKVRDSEAGKE